MQYILHLVFATIAACIGILLNGYILFVLLWHRRIQNANHVLLLHLALVDIMFCLIIIPYNNSAETVEISNDLGSNPIPSKELCGAHGIAWTLLPSIMLWTVCGFSCDRYAAIARPLQYSRLVTSKRTVLFLGVAWISGIVFVIPPLLGVCPYSFSLTWRACGFSCSRNPSDLVFLLMYFAVTMLVPVTVIVLCNAHVFLIARYHRHRIISAIYDVTVQAQATVTHQRNPCVLNRYRGRSAVITTAKHVGSLVLFIIPYFISVFWEGVSGQPTTGVVATLATVLFTCAPPVNAYVYGVKSRILRQTLKGLLQRYLYKQEASREVERRLSIISGKSQRSSVHRRMSLPFINFVPPVRSSWFHCQEESRRSSQDGRTSSSVVTITPLQVNAVEEIFSKVLDPRTKCNGTAPTVIQE